MPGLSNLSLAMKKIKIKMCIICSGLSNLGLESFYIPGGAWQIS